MGFSSWMALRYLSASRRGGLLGRVSLLALVGVAVGVATLLTVFAFVSGFQVEVRRLLTGMNPAVFVSSAELGGLAEPQALAADLETVPGVAAAAAFIQQKGVASAQAAGALRLRGVILRGIDPAAEPRVTGVLSRCEPPFTGFSLPGMEPGCLLGVALAEELGVLPGETITFTTVLEGSGREPLHTRLTVLGTVRTGLYEFDRRFAYADLAFCRRQFRAGGGADGLGLRVDDVMAADTVAGALRERLGFADYRVASWIDLNGEIFRWMGTMRAILFIALSLIILVAGFNIAGAMTIIVTERTRAIGLLLSLGARRREVLGIFLLEGWLIGLAGVIAGTGLGLALTRWFSHHPLSLPGEVYFIDHMPARLSPALLAVVGGAAVVVALLALVAPGVEALRRTPMDTLQEGGMRA
jgi:lipoprotein-releasing system permease protein